MMRKMKLKQYYIKNIKYFMSVNPVHPEGWDIS